MNSTEQNNNSRGSELGSDNGSWRRIYWGVMANTLLIYLFLWWFSRAFD